MVANIYMLFFYPVQKSYIVEKKSSFYLFDFFKKKDACNLVILSTIIFDEIVHVSLQKINLNVPIY